MAKYVLNWKLRQGGSAQQNHDDGDRLLATFSKWQPPADQNFLQFLQRIDGQGGVAVIETDSPASLFAEVAKFDPWQEFEVIPVIDLLESTPLAAAASEFRKSV
jgi:hypothetical protein